MRSDALLAFVPIGGNLSIVAAAGVAVASNVIDLLGLGQGLAPTNIIGNATLFGMDPGIGGPRPEINCVVGTAFTNGTGTPSLNVQLQYAPDLGTPSYLPGTWVTIAETGELLIASLAANTVIARFPWLPAVPASARPRYVRLNFHVLAATNFAAGTIASAIVTFVRDDQANKYVTKNYTVA